eukprot:TRINITY_DN14734_c1_g1_i1.p1 TRINITY_DN14734_c1_g1~~TRINITY_DN14734_c1_g1_i1.p1  ORF type:complete len:675 (+),score=168.83 TRINITY_DN14734_c1_g1_i1:174-2027(+)
MSERPKKKRSLWRLLSLARPEACTLCASGLLLTSYTSCTLAIPWYLGRLIDLSAMRERGRQTTRSILALTGLFTLSGISNLGRLWLTGVAQERIIFSLRSRLFGHLLQQPFSFFDEEGNRVADLCQRLNADVEKVGVSIVDFYMNGMRALCQATGSLAIMYWLSPSLASLLLVAIPAAGVSSVCFGQIVARPLERKRADAAKEAVVVSTEYIDGVRVVYSYNRERDVCDSYLQSIDRVRSTGQRMAAARGSYTVFLQSSGYAVVLALVGYGGSLVARGWLTVGSLNSMLLYSTFGGLGIMGCTSLVSDLYVTLGTAERLFDLMDTSAAGSEVERSRVAPAHGLPEDAVAGEVTVSRCSFAYPNRPEATVLNNVSFTLRGGRCCAIVGPSGCGKSTLFALLLRLYNPTQGSIALDGVDVSEMTAEYLRRLIAYVPQDPHLFVDTIAANIMHGLPSDVEVTEGRREWLLQTAMQLANVDEFCSDTQRFPQGVRTRVGERGTSLSGGQKQRIAIARALVRVLCGCAKLLLFDEPAAALDAASQNQLRQTMRRVLTDRQVGGRTVVVITHDEDLMKHCDHVVVIRDSGVVAEGAYEQVEHEIKAMCLSDDHVVVSPTASAS